MPSGFFGSNAGTGRRFERTGLARQWSRHPSAMGKTSRLLRRQVLRNFALRGGLILLFANGSREHFQASQVRPQRQRLQLFESTRLIGTKTVTDNKFSAGDSATGRFV
jgi:hypothetical protein